MKGSTKKRNPLFNSDKEFPILAGVAVGLYPLISYYTHNFTSVNSWGHFGYFVGVFLILPALFFYVFYRWTKMDFFKKWRPYLLFILSVFVFLFFIEISLNADVKKKIAVGTLVAVIPLSFVFYKQLNRIIALQYLIACIGLFSLVPALIQFTTLSSEWTEQPDSIASTLFKEKPNVYFIQPDGYVNFSEISRGYYNIDNSAFETYLQQRGFKNYPNFRSNYPSTLASNAAVFSMKHHYFNGDTHPSESLRARELLVSDNAVLNVFKSNGYRTHLILEAPYIMLNKPKMGYDVSNFSKGDVPFIGTGFRSKRDVTEGFDAYIKKDPLTPKFFFVEFFNPGHIKNNKGDTSGATQERELWKESLEMANFHLEKLIEQIVIADPEALIIMLSDHGGYVGLDYANEMYQKTTDRDLIYSIFGSQLSIRWPNNTPPEFDDALESSVNVFRILFAYLSDDVALLKHLEEDASFLILSKGAPKGVYKYLDSEGKVVCEKHE